MTYLLIVQSILLKTNNGLVLELAAVKVSRLVYDFPVGSPGPKVFITWEQRTLEFKVSDCVCDRTHSRPVKEETVHG